METLSTVIKFVANQNEVSQTGSSAATGDVCFLIFWAIVLLIGLFVIGFIVLQRKKITFGSHVLSASKTTFNKFTIPLIVGITVIFALFVCAMGIGHTKALAEENAALTGAEQVTGRVDVQTGNVAFAEALITNNSENPQTIHKFDLYNIDGVNVGSVTWKITLGDIVVYNDKIGQTGEFRPFNIEGKSSVSMKVEIIGLMPDIAKLLVDKDVALGTTSYKEVVPTQCYLGTVLHPDEAGTKDIGLEDATVTFTDSLTNNIVSAITDQEGKYTLDVAVGTAGTISVTKCPETHNVEDYGYSTDSFSVDTTKKEQQEAHIGKIKSLSVKVFQHDATEAEPALKNTYWCPAFSGNPSAMTSINIKDIKFYSSPTQVIDKRDTLNRLEPISYYKMSDLVDSNATDKTADNTMKAKYFAICKAGNSLHCYQTADFDWNSVFEILEESTTTKYHAIANSLKYSFVAAWDSHCSDPLAKTVYFDGSDDSNSWKRINITSWQETNPPTVNGINYSQDKTKPESPDDWYKTYGGRDGGVLSYFSYLPWSAVGYDNSIAFAWDVDGGYWNNNYRDIVNGGVVLSRVFCS